MGHEMSSGMLELSDQQALQIVGGCGATINQEVALYSGATTTIGKVDEHRSPGRHFGLCTASKASGRNLFRQVGGPL